MGTSALVFGCGDEDGGKPQIFTISDSSTDTNTSDLTAQDIEDEQTTDTSTSIDTSILADQTDTPDDSCIPQTCEASGTECGPTDDGCGQPLNCGTCETDMLCQSGQCVPDCGSATSAALQPAKSKALCVAKSPTAAATASTAAHAPKTLCATPSANANPPRPSLR